MCARRLLLRACIGVLTFMLGWAGAVLTGTAHYPGRWFASRVVINEVARPHAIDSLPPQPPGSFDQRRRHSQMHPAFEWQKVSPDIIDEEFDVPAPPPPPRPPAR